MPKFSLDSKRKLSTCNPALQRLFSHVIADWDCTILEGERSAVKQVKNIAAGVSKTMDSKHLLGTWDPIKQQVVVIRQKADAVDAAPYPLRWPKRPPPDAPFEALLNWAKDLARYYYFAGHVKAVAISLGIGIRWGGDWDNDHDIHDQSFDDLVHYELL